MASNGKEIMQPKSESAQNYRSSPLPGVPQRIMDLLRSSNLSCKHVKEIETIICNLIQGQQLEETAIDDNEGQVDSAATAEYSKRIRKKAHRGKRSGRQTKEKAEPRKNEALSNRNQDAQLEPANDHEGLESEKPKATRGQRGGQQKTAKIERWNVERQAKEKNSEAKSQAQI